MKRIGFVGFDSEDIALYLARLLQTDEDNVVVVDHTRKLSLMRNAGIPHQLTGKSGMYRGNIEIFASATACKFRKDAVIIDYFGCYTELPEIKDCDIVIFTTDMIVYNAQLLKDVHVKDGAAKFLILRNAIRLKYDESYLIVETGQEFSRDQVFVIPYDEVDYRSKCYLCIDKMHSLGGLSEPMRKTLLYLYSYVEEKELKRKETALLLKQA